MADDGLPLFDWQPPAPTPPAPAEFGADDTGHRAAVLRRLGDLQWHGGLELIEIGGTRYGARIHELRHEHGWDIEQRCVAQGEHEYRLIGRRAPEAKKPTWKERALAAEERVRELEAQLAGGATK